MALNLHFAQTGYSSSCVVQRTNKEDHSYSLIFERTPPYLRNVLRSPNASVMVFEPRLSSSNPPPNDPTEGDSQDDFSEGDSQDDSSEGDSQDDSSEENSQDGSSEEGSQDVPAERDPQDDHSEGDSQAIATSSANQEAEGGKCFDDVSHSSSDAEPSIHLYQDSENDRDNQVPTNHGEMGDTAMKGAEQTNDDLVTSADKKRNVYHPSVVETFMLTFDLAQRQ